MLTRVDTSDHPEPIATALEISQRELDEHTVVFSVRGEIDLSTAPNLKWALVDAIDAGRTQLVVDLSGTTFMDSTALGVLVGVNRSLGADARLAIACAQPSVLKIFELSGMDGVFAIFAMLERALAHVRGETAKES